MSKRTAIYILTALLINVLLLIILFKSTVLPNQRSNGFTRNWNSNSPTLIKHKVLKLDIEQICGATENHIFISGADPRWIVQLDLNLNSKDTLFFSIEPNPKIRSLTTYVDSPDIYMYANNIGYIISGHTKSSYVDTLRIKSNIFTKVARVTPELLIIRGLDSSGVDQTFMKVNCLNGEITKTRQLIEQLGTGGFGADGFLQFDSSTSKLIYLQMFQNRFYCFDTNLNNIYTGQTIDTNATNSVELGIIKENDLLKLTPTNSRQPINTGAIANSGLLFVKSALKADNEEMGQFRNGTPIDVYKISSGSYLCSFRVPLINGQEINQLYIHKKYLIVLYKKNTVAIFKLPSITESSRS